MRVAVNAVHLVPGETGGFEIYARRLLPALAALSELELVVVTGPSAARMLREDGTPVEIEVIRVDARSRVRGVLAEQAVLPRVVRRLRPQLLHNLFNTAPAAPGVPQVTTIHDVIYRRFPETHAGVLTWGLRVLVPLGVRRSRRLVAVSQATKDDIVRFLDVREDRIDVVPNGPGFPPTAEPTPEDDLRHRLVLGDGAVVLALSAKRPHKNLERLIEAMCDVDAILVLPGYATPFEDELRALAERLGVGRRVRFAGWLDQSDIEGLYALATCVVVPSLAEGFGLPVLEAMQRGAPVATSNATSLPEVAGDAALYFEPTNTNAIADAVNRLLADDGLRRQLGEAGRAQAAKFSWERAAEGTAASYRRALE